MIVRTAITLAAAGIALITIATHAILSKRTRYETPSIHDHHHHHHHQG
jgi:hypothetical protein